MKMVAPSSPDSCFDQIAWHASFQHIHHAVLKVIEPFHSNHRLLGWPETVNENEIPRRKETINKAVQRVPNKPPEGFDVLGNTVIALIQERPRQAFLEKTKI